MTNTYNADFSSIKQSIIDFMKKDETFKSYNFDGAAINNVMNILAYIEQNAAFYLNNTANEFFIGSAVQTKNIYKNAKQLGYFPRRKSAGRINVTFSNVQDTVIPKFTTFTMDGINLVLFDNVVLNAENSRTVTASLYEGTLLTETSVVNSTNMFSQTLTTKYTDIDNDYVYVYVDSLVNNDYVENNTPWINADFELLEANTNSFFTDFTDLLFTVKFDNGRLFNIPKISDRIRIKYLKTSGTSVNGSGGTITTSENIPFLTIDRGSNTISGGLDEESNESIKAKATLFHTSLNRAVTENDWKAVLKNFSKSDLYKACHVIGGEKENIPLPYSQTVIEGPATYQMLGRVIISTLKNDFTFLNQTEIDEIIAYANNYKIAGLKLKFMQPNILTITPTINIKTSPDVSFSLMSFSSIINEYLNTFENFNTAFYKTKLIKKIEEQNSILYTDVSFSTKVIVRNDDTNKIIRLGNAITPSSITGTIDGLAFVDNGSGIVRYNNINVGTVNYSTGCITLTSQLSILPEYEFNFTPSSTLYFNSTRETCFKFEDCVVVTL